jgi:hypothetical protein
MPRGGRRPGAGAPRNNFNAIGRGNSSRRLRLIYTFVTYHPDQRALANELYAAGFFRGSPPYSPYELPDIYRYIWEVYFDCSRPGQSISINPAHSLSPRTAPPPASRRASKKRQ